MNTNNNNYITKDITTFGVMVTAIGLVIGILYWYDSASNIFSDIAKQVYGSLVG